MKVLFGRNITDYPGAQVCSVNRYLSKTTKHLYPAALEASINCCWSDYLNAILQEVETIVVDVSHIEKTPYMALANAYGYEISEVEE